MADTTPRYADGRTYVYLGKRARYDDHIGAVPDHRALSCGMVALGAVGDCTRAVGHDGAHQNGATGDTFETGAYDAVDFDTFLVAMTRAREESSLVAEMTSEPTDVEMTIYALARDGRSGYAVRPDGELVLVFSLERGRGDVIVSGAVADGAVYLDCFDGYLPRLYGRHGFVECQRVANWTPGEPDVIYMSLPGFESRHGVSA